MSDAERKAAEQAYTMLAHDYESAPIGSRDWVIFWNGWRERSEQPPCGADGADWVDRAMTLAQEFASSWSLVGGRFDDGDMLESAEQRKAELRALLASQPAAPVAPATVAVPDVFCVGRAQYPARGGNVGLQWHVVGVADVPYRTCVPKDGELLFVLAASQREGVKS